VQRQVLRFLVLLVAGGDGDDPGPRSPATRPAAARSPVYPAAAYRAARAGPSSPSTVSALALAAANTAANSSSVRVRRTRRRSTSALSVPRVRSGSVGRRPVSTSQDVRLLMAAV
jgi:hypothetical protein